MQSCCKFFLSKAPFTRSRFCLKTDISFLRLSLPSTLTNALKLITENAPFQERSLESRLFKTSAFLLRVDGRKRFQIRNTMMSFIIYF